MSGSTKYFVESSVDLPGFDKTESKLFHVNHYRCKIVLFFFLIHCHIYRNLNTEPKTLEKVEKNKSTTFGMLCCETGPISLDYSINKTGFVCGEKAQINIKVLILYLNCILSSISTLHFQVDNASGKEVKEIKVIFLQTLKFHGVYKPPKPKPKKQKPGKAKKNKSLIKKKTAKVRPAREPTAIKKTKVIKMINVDIKFSNWSVTSLINFFVSDCTQYN